MDRQTDPAHTASRLILASPAAIYEAHLDPEAVVRWRAPAGMRGRLFRFEPWAGGQYQMSLEHEDPDQRGKTEGGTDLFEGRFAELLPERRIVELVQFASEDPAFQGEMRLITTLEPDGAGTRVTILAEEVPSGISAEDHAVGMASALANLARWVEGADALLLTQRDRLIALGVPALAGLTDAAFAALVEPLRPLARRLLPAPLPAPTPARAPLILVVSGALVPAELLVPLLRLPGGSAPGVLDRNHGPEGLAPYLPLPALQVPEAPVYLLLDVARGEEFCGVRPVEALPQILAAGRTPLTLHEGLALALHQPAALEKNRCFMLAGSRRGDQRVPAIWISGRAPKLGWCWDGNLHAWLGVASAGGRAAAE